MAFIALFFVAVILIGAPLSALFYLTLSLIFRHLHRKYLQRSPEPARTWRRILSVVFGVLSGINLAAGAAGWIFYLIAFLST